jgi:anthranilate synthase component 2
LILLLDNYDSFVHNVARYLRLAGKATRVIRSDAITAEQCYQLQPEAIVLSPGPHRPEQAGCCLDVVRMLAGEIPILGICLGHQTIAAAYGGEVATSPPAHAMATQIQHDSTGVFAGIESRFLVGRYHSLCVVAKNLPPSLQITAWTCDEDARNEKTMPIVMGISDHARCVHGVQFHPESLLTEHGHALIANFFGLVDRHHARARRVHGATVGTGRPVVWMSQTGLSYRTRSSSVLGVELSPAADADCAVPLPTLSIAQSRELARQPATHASEVSN